MKQKLMINYLGLFALENFSPKFFKLCWWLFSIEPLSFLFLLLPLCTKKSLKKKKKKTLFSIGTSSFTVKHHSTITCFFLALCHIREYHPSFSGGETKEKTCTTIPGNVTPWWKQRQMQGFKIPVFRVLESFHYISFSKVIMWSLFLGKKKKKVDTVLFWPPLQTQIAA